MPASDATLSITSPPLLHKDSMTSAQIDPDLARDALLAHPLVAAQTLLGLAAAKISRRRRLLLWIYSISRALFGRLKARS